MTREVTKHMTNELLRKEPTIAHYDDIPVLNDRINVSWDKLSRVLEPVRMPTMPPEGGALSDKEMALVLAGDRIAENVSAQMDDILSMAINNSYHRLRADLTNQLRAAVKEAVHEEIEKIVQSDKRSTLS